MGNSKLANSSAVLFIVLTSMLYIFWNEKIYLNYFSYLFFALILLEAISILFSDYGTLVSFLTYILLVATKIGFFNSIPTDFIYLMIIVSFLIFPSRIFLKRGNLSAYIIYSSLAFSFYFYDFSIYTFFVYYLTFLVILFLVGYILSRNSDNFVGYFITFFLIISFIAVPPSYIANILNYSFCSMLDISLILIMPLLLIIFLQDTLYDKNIPYTGIGISIIITILLYFFTVNAIIMIALIVSVTIITAIILGKMLGTYDSDISVFGLFLISLVKFSFIKSIYLLGGILLTFIIFYIIIKKLKKSYK